ncbi:MAG: hypothetical protein WB870_17010 [Gallionellaceae bacterium]
MKATTDVIMEAAGQFHSPALAILARVELSGVHLRLDDGNLIAKGNRQTITAWQPMIQRHKPEIIAALTGQTCHADGDGVLAADYAELTDCIGELCQLVGYADDIRDRMLAALRNLYPVQVASECAYFRLQVIRAGAGTYWQDHGGTTTPATTDKSNLAHPGRRAA